MPNGSKYRRKLWILCLLIGAEIVAIWLIIRFFIARPDYQPLIKTPDVPDIQPSIPLPTDDIIESNIEAINDALQAKIFSLGTLDNEVLQALGEPVWRKPGFWTNSIAWSYKDIGSSGIDIGYIFDIHTNKLRQVEIAVPPSTNFNTVRVALKSLLGESITPSIARGLKAVYQRQQVAYNFTLENKKGVIQRNDKDRIYIGVWEVNFH